IHVSSIEIHTECQLGLRKSGGPTIGISRRKMEVCLDWKPFRPRFLRYQGCESVTLVCAQAGKKRHDAVLEMCRNARITASVCSGRPTLIRMQSRKPSLSK